VRVGAYEIVSKIGQGGAGSVYRARAQDGRDVALKFLRRSDDEALARFEREARLLASLGEREGYVPLLDKGRTRDGTFFVMPFLAGGTLRARLDRGPFSVAATLELGRTVARSLGAAHARGIVHRDVKPENILFPTPASPPRAALLADLGVAKHFDLEAKGASLSVSLSREGRLLGTAGYMAPEQIADAKNAGPPADVHALGCVLFECLTGTPAFVGDTPLELMTRIADGRRTDLERRVAPAWVIAVIDRALAQDPLSRYPDGHAFARALSGEQRRSLKVPLLAGLGTLAVALGVALVLARPRGALVAARPRDREALALIERGIEKERTRAFDRAIADFTLALERTPDLAIAWARRAEARGELYDYDGELADAKKAIELDPGLELAWRCRGDARGNLGDAEGEIQDESRAIELDPGDAKAWYCRGSIRAWKGDLDGGLADTERALELDPKDACAWIVRGDARCKKGDLEGALADANRAVEMAPYVSSFWATRAGMRELRGDLAGSIADMTRALALEPKRPLYWARRGQIRGRTGDLDGKIADLTRAVEIDPRFATAWVERGATRADKGDIEGAIADETRAIELEPRRLEGWTNRAARRYDVHDYEGAVADATRAIELRPNLANAWLTRAAAHEAIHDAAGAIADYTRFLELAPADPQAPLARERVARLGGR
jgi:tetratricopeptide (TPR) repeat protein